MTRRQKGTFGILDNWVLQAAPRLPLAAGWALIALENQSNYDKSGLDLVGLCAATGRSDDQMRRALVFLLEFGLARQEGRTYFVGDSSRINAALEQAETRKDARIYARKNARINAVSDQGEKPSSTKKTAALKDKKDLKDKKEQITPPTPPRDDLAIPERLTAREGFGQAWSDWLSYRRARKLTTTSQTLTAQLAMLAAQSEPEATIAQSIEKGWQGLFPLKGPFRNTTLPRPNELNAQDWDEEERRLEAMYANYVPQAVGHDD